VPLPNSGFILSDPHFQTIWANRVRRPPSVALRPERLELEDGDFLDLFWSGGEGPLVAVFPGLLGSVQSSNILCLLAALGDAGFSTLSMNYRGSAGVLNRLPRAYHAGETGDIRTVFSLLGRRFPGRSLLAIGYSLGANALLKYLGEEGNSCPLRAAVAVSAPIDMESCSWKLEEASGRLYNFFFLRGLRSLLRMKAHQIAPLGIDVRAGLKSRTCREYDDRITAPLYGFTSCDDYYRKSSARPLLQRISIPTLLVSSLDDPILGDACYPKPEELAPSVEMELSERGGHLGFLHGSPLEIRSWMEERTIQFFVAATEKEARNTATE
jgi:uncharacterized protein